MGHSGPGNPVWGIVAAIIFQRLRHLPLHRQRGTVIGEDLEKNGSAQINVTAEDIGHSLSQILIVVIHQALGERQVVRRGSQKVPEPNEMCNVHD